MVSLSKLKEKMRALDIEVNRFENELLKKEEENYISSGKKLYEKKEFAAAASSFDEALKMNPRNAEALTYKGAAFSELKQYKDSLLALNSALKIDSEYKYAWYWKGIVLKNLGKKEKAVEYFEKTLELDPDYKYAKAEKTEYLIGVKRKTLEDKMRWYETKERKMEEALEAVKLAHKADLNQKNIEIRWLESELRRYRPRKIIDSGQFGSSIYINSLRKYTLIKKQRIPNKSEYSSFEIIKYFQNKGIKLSKSREWTNILEEAEKNDYRELAENMLSGDMEVQATIIAFPSRKGNYSSRISPKIEKGKYPVMLEEFKFEGNKNNIVGGKRKELPALPKTSGNLKKDIPELGLPKGAFVYVDSDFDYEEGIRSVLRSTWYLGRDERRFRTSLLWRLSERGRGLASRPVFWEEKMKMNRSSGSERWAINIICLYKLFLVI